MNLRFSRQLPFLKVSRLSFLFVVHNDTCYLSNPKQLVKVENVQSDFVDISNGVSLWSVLRPLLFIMYINDLPKSSAFYSPFKNVD